MKANNTFYFLYDIYLDKLIIQNASLDRYFQILFNNSRKW